LFPLVKAARSGARSDAHLTAAANAATRAGEDKIPLKTDKPFGAAARNACPQRNPARSVRRASANCRTVTIMRNAMRCDTPEHELQTDVPLPLK
jgi:hypothetical protein